MHLGRVAGTLVASHKEELLEGMKFLVVRQLGVDNEETGSYVVAVDAVDPFARHVEARVAFIATHEEADGLEDPEAARQVNRPLDRTRLL